MTIIAQYCEDTGDGCECTSPVTAEYDIEIPAGNFSKTIQIEGTKPFTVKNISVDEWCTVTFNNGLKFEGSIESGSHKQVVQVENQCGKAVIVVTITVAVECTGAIEKDIAIKDGKVSETIQVPGGEIISASVGTATATLYGTDLIIKGNASPGPYNVKMNDACGTIVSGDFYQCIVPKLLSTTGIADFERQTPATFSWVIAGNSIKTKNPILPAGLSVSTTEASGQTTVTVSGSPSQNTGNGTMSVVVYNDCGTLTLTQKYTQTPCKGIRVTGESGDAAFEIGEAGEFCKIIEGYEPMNIVEFADIPKGMAATLTKIGTNKYKVCVTGTPVTDLCDESQELSCKCSKVTIRNECGDTVVELCSSTVKPLPRPLYCVGLVVMTPITNAAPDTYKIEVLGVVPNTTVSLTGFSVASFDVDATGYGAVTAQLQLSQGCGTITHPTCALIKANAPIDIACKAAPVTP
jgi:hypothetical protein